MRLVVTGAYSLGILQERVVQCFSDIPGNSRSGSVLLSDITVSPVGRRGEYSWDDVYQSPMKDIGLPLNQSCLGKLFGIAPVKDRHSLSVTWQIPSIYDKWRSKPTDYIAHLIGHEAKGSLLASLKEKSWATCCWAGVGSEGYEVRQQLQIDTCKKTLAVLLISNTYRLFFECFVACLVYYFLDAVRGGCRQLVIGRFGTLSICRYAEASLPRRATQVDL
jgi:hypothetical protein